MIAGHDEKNPLVLIARGGARAGSETFSRVVGVVQLVGVEAIKANLESRLDEARRAVFAREKPATLCHYTDRGGLAGILQTRQIWGIPAAEHRTDRRELRHADPSIMQVAWRLAKEPPRRPHEREFLRELAKDWRDGSLFNKARRSLFISCFSPFSDNATAWEVFANGATGFAIEFELLDEDLDTPGLGLGLFEVEYSKLAAERRLARAIQEAFKIGRAFEDCNPIARGEHVRSLVRQALWLAAATTAVGAKANQYAGQREWRIAALRVDDRCVVHTTPRVHVKIPLRNEPHPPSIRAIHIGACALPDSEMFVRQLLNEHGYAEARPPIVHATATSRG